MVYGRGILMIEAARWLARHRLLAVWKEPTWIHLVSTPDFLRATEAAALRDGVEGIYHIGDERPVTLQHFLDCGDTQRMRAELVPDLVHPTLESGLSTLEWPR